MKFQYSFIQFLLTTHLASSSICESVNYNYISLEIISDTSTEIVDSNSNYLKQAVFCTTYSTWVVFQGCSYIWSSSNPQSAEKVYFRRKFYITGEPSSGTMDVACDDLVDVYVNGIKVDCSGAGYSSKKSCIILSVLKSGLNTLFFDAYSHIGVAGLIFKINVESKF